MELKVKQRIALGTCFFITGVCFSTWASRIPTLKAMLDLNDAELGNILLTMPIGSLIGLPISGWLVSRFDSRIPLIVSFFIFTLALIGIGFATTPFLLIASIAVFSFNMRILNITINTQAITLQKTYGKKINGSFHGVWSTGGLVGVCFTTLMLKLDVPIRTHMAMVAVFSVCVILFVYRFLLKHDRAKQGNKLILGKPDPSILCLGFLVFFASICEGGMFDWSGIYFREVVKEELFTLGYLIFIACMAFSRFYSDRFVQRFGMKKTYAVSSSLIAVGIALAIIFPFFWTTLAGFCLVGLGTAAIIPMTYTLAGTSEKYSAGMAISIIATYGIMGMFIGPPLIGYLSHAFNLKVSFILFIFSGLMLIPVSIRFFQLQKK